jgi:hypothetical protein
MPRSTKSRALACLLLALAGFARPAPSEVPHTEAVRVGTPPTMDGALDDPAWARSASVRLVRADGKDPTEPTTVFFACDDDHVSNGQTQG